MVLEEGLRTLNEKKKEIQINREYLNNLRFADYIVLMNELMDELQQMILQLHRESQKVGLKMNIKKTKVMFNNFR